MICSCDLDLIKELVTFAAEKGATHVRWHEFEISLKPSVNYNDKADKNRELSLDTLATGWEAPHV